MNQAHCVRRGKQRSKGFTIKVVTARGRATCLVANSELERDKWLHVLLQTVGTCTDRRASLQRSASDVSFE